jgi:hypothetical protein
MPPNQRSSLNRPAVEILATTEETEEETETDPSLSSFNEYNRWNNKRVL